MKLQGYGEYEDTGLQWIGSLPLHWKIVPLRYIVTCLDGARVPLNAIERSEMQGQIPYWGANCVVDFVDRPILNEPLVLLGEDGAPFFDRTKPVAFYSEGPIWPNNHIHVLRPASRVLGQFLVHALNTTDYTAFIQGSTRDKLTQSAMAAIPIPLPSIEEQSGVIEFLDRETAKIDALVEEQKRLIELLKEKRQAVISQAVTKGLDPNVPMKDSGVEWLGQMPSSWKVTPLKRLCVLLKDGTHLPPPRVAEGVPLLSVRNIQGGVFSKLDDDSMISEDSYQDLCRSFVPQHNDVLLAIVGATLGKTALVPEDLGRFHIQRSLAIFRPKCELTAAWLHLVFQSTGFQALLWESVGFSAQPGIYLGTLAEVRVPIPPVQLQMEIERSVALDLKRLDELITEADKAMLLLGERRSALISAAVTGKIDVRGLVPKSESVAA